MMRFLVGGGLLLVGVGLVVFGVMVWLQLRAAALAGVAPAPGDYPLFEMMMPAVPPGVPVRPADLARSVMHRIYALGGFGLVLVGVGVMACFTGKPQPDGSGE